MSFKGFFVSVEGVEGVGKSTAIGYIQQLFNDANIEHVLTREPGGTPLAETIRDLLLTSHEEEVTASTELLLMFAARSQNVQQIILPALQAGKWVLADRFTDASFAYQGGGRGVNITSIEGLAQMVLGDLQPNLTLLLDAPVSVGMQRIQEKNVELDRIELEQNDFFQRVRQQYLALASQHADRYRIIDATQPLHDVQQQIKQHLQPYLAGWRA
jgi:dTMP kinase